MPKNRKKWRLNSGERLMLLMCFALLLFLVAWIYGRPHAIIAQLSPGTSLSNLQFSPDSQMLLVEQEFDGPPTPSGITKFYSQTFAYDRITKSPLWKTDVNPGSTMPHFSRDGHRLLLGNGDNLELRDGRTLRLIWKTPTRNPGSYFKFSPNERYVSAWFEVRDAQTGKPIFNHSMMFPGRQACWPAPRWLNDYQLRFVTFPLIQGGTKDPALYIHTLDTRTGRVTTLPSLHRLMSVELSYDGQKAIILVQESDPARNTLQFWDLKQNRRLHQWPAPGKDELFSWLEGKSGIVFYARNQATNKEGETRYVNTATGEVQLWQQWDKESGLYNTQRWRLVPQSDGLALRDRATGQIKRFFAANIDQAAISPDERTLATAERNLNSKTTDIRLWD